MPTIKLSAKALNTVYVPHLRNYHRYQIYFGGSSSGKSVFLASRAVLDCLQGRNILVTRKVARTLRGSCWNEVSKAIYRFKLQEQFKINKSDMQITALNNGAQILFAGLDDVEKIKSITPQNGNLTDIWIEEATEVDYEDYKQLDKRLRGRTEHLKRITLSFNPIIQSHWIFKTFFGIWQEGKTYAETDTTSILKTTYLDNRFLTADDRSALENETDPYFYNVYTLGNWGLLSGALFTKYPEFTKDASMLRDGIAHIDASYGGEDYTAFTCGKKVGDKIYLYGRLWNAHVDTVVDHIIADSKRLMCAPIYCETNGDKGFLGRDLRVKGASPRMYAERMNKFVKISSFLRKWWNNVVFLEGTDLDYINQIMEYTETAEHDDAPDSAACVCRLFDRDGRVIDIT